MRRFEWTEKAPMRQLLRESPVGTYCLAAEAGEEIQQLREKIAELETLVQWYRSRMQWFRLRDAQSEPSEEEWLWMWQGEEHVPCCPVESFLSRKHGICESDTGREWYAVDDTDEHPIWWSRALVFNPPLKGGSDANESKGDSLRHQRRD